MSLLYISNSTVLTHYIGCKHIQYFNIVHTFLHPFKNIQKCYKPKSNHLVDLTVRNITNFLSKVIIPIHSLMSQTDILEIFCVANYLNSNSILYERAVSA